MLKELESWEGLAQVWFVVDYIQLKFYDDHCLNIYNPFSVTLDGKTYEKGQFGYADSLVRVIGSNIKEVVYEQYSHLKLIFSCGLELTINLTKGIVNFPEAFELGLSDGPYIEFNA